METPIEQVEPIPQHLEWLKDEDMTPEQIELAISLDRALAQSERGEYRPAREFLEELRQLEEAGDHARRNGR